jgi:hypothetical protein
VFEAVAARIAKRKALDLYHSALVVSVPGGRFVIEQAPARSNGDERGVVATGPVGAAWAGRFTIFRYEVRRWRDGTIPDIAEAVESPCRVTADPKVAQYLLGLVPALPVPVWGRDELRTGEMWNSNSVVAWLLTRAGVDAESVPPPEGGRAPGWHAGVVAAQRLEGRGVRAQAGD